MTKCQSRRHLLSSPGPRRYRRGCKSQESKPKQRVIPPTLHYTNIKLTVKGNRLLSSKSTRKTGKHIK